MKSCVIMEKATIINCLQQATISKDELIIKEEINEDFSDGVGNYVKCGEVFFVQTERIILICGFCAKSYADMNQFGVHVHENHLSQNQTVGIFEKIDEHESLKIENRQEDSHDYEDISHVKEHETLKIEDVEEDSYDYEDMYDYDVEHADEVWSSVVTTFQSESDSMKDFAKEAEGPKRPSKKSVAERRDIKNPDLYCTICQIQYESKVRFEKHNEKKHNILRACEFCNKPFNSLEERSQHERTHVGDSPYTCLQCSMVFKQKYYRDKHIEYVHEGIKRHKCSICDRSFATGSILRAHETVHSSLSGQHSCEICGRQFAHESVMKLHVKWHKGEKTFQCEECGKRYLTRNLLNNHKKRHGEKNVECEICCKKFYTNRSLKEHIQVHSERLHACSICGSAFKRSYHLKRHMHLHFEVKKYSCDICGIEFAQSVRLITHKKKHHGSIRKEFV